MFFKKIIQHLGKKNTAPSAASSTDFNKTEYCLEKGKRVYAIGDVHGCDTILQNVLDIMIADSKKYPDATHIFVGLGDYVDRGPDSQNVIELLITKIPAHFEKIFIKGNHEVYMQGFMEDPHEFDLWLQYGGRETLLSYNVLPPDDRPSDQNRAAKELRDNLPQTHHQFLKGLKNYHIIDDYVFVHAGIDPDTPLDQNSEMTLTTIRTKFLDHRGHFHGKKIVHGHTPTETPELFTHRVNLDTGAYLTHKLTLAVFHENMIDILT